MVFEKSLNSSGALTHDKVSRVVPPKTGGLSTIYPWDSYWKEIKPSETYISENNISRAELLKEGQFFNRHIMLNGITKRKLESLGLTVKDRMAFKRIAGNLLYAMEVEEVLDIPQFVFFSRSRDYYRANGFYFSDSFKDVEHSPAKKEKDEKKENTFTYDRVIKILNILIDKGYIEQYKGFYNRAEQTGRITRIRSTQKFYNEILLPLKLNSKNTNKNIISQATPYKFIRCKNEKGEWVIPTNKEKAEYIEYKLSKINEAEAKRTYQIKVEHLISAREEHLKRLNEKRTNNTTTQQDSLLGKVPSYTWINPDKLDIPNEIDYLKNRIRYFTRLLLKAKDGYVRLDNQYVAIYNNAEMTKGGRYYRSEIQNLPRMLRQYVTVDGKELGCLDYSNLHPRMLYAKQGIDYQEDIYDIQGLERHDAKILVNICINSSDMTQAISAIRYRQTNGEFSSSAPPYQLIAKFRNKHPKLVPFIFSGAGIELQAADALLAIEIMDKMSNINSPIVCLHDGFMVPTENMELLEQAMNDAYRECFSFNAKIKVDK